MKLVRPTEKYESQWRRAVIEFKGDFKSIKLWEVLGDPNDLDEIARNARLHSQGKNLPAGWVSHDVLWLIDGDKFIGIVSIRHKLNDHLRKVGGHIGYEIRPSMRGKGYANEMLKLALTKIKKLGVKKVLMTVFENNIVSIKVIEKNGGKLKDKIQNEGEEDLTRRYWINLQKP